MHLRQHTKTWYKPNLFLTGSRSPQASLNATALQTNQQSQYTRSIGKQGYHMIAVTIKAAFIPYGIMLQ